jgi:hypothetical protein
MSPSSDVPGYPRGVSLELPFIEVESNRRSQCLSAILGDEEC